MDWTDCWINIRDVDVDGPAANSADRFSASLISDDISFRIALSSFDMLV